MKKNKKNDKKNDSGLKQFLRYFIVAFFIMTVVFLPVRYLLNKIGGIQPFEAEENLMDNMVSLVGEDSPFFEAFQDKQRVNILLLGVNGGMTDTIMVASFDMEAQHVDLISVPRDTYYHRDGYDGAAEKKINAAYRGSALNTAKAVSETLMGMPLHYYAVIEYDGVRKIVDSVGGIPMDIPFAMKYRDPTDKPPLVINIPKGEQVLDGEHAVQFLRYRKGYVEGDLGRVKAQQTFMKAAFKQLLQSDLLKSTKVIFKNVESDITLDMSLKIATKAIGMKEDSIETYMIPNTPEPEAPYYVYPKAKEIGVMLEEIYSIEPESTSDSALSDKDKKEVKKEKTKKESKSKEDKGE